VTATKLSARDLTLLALLTVFWGFNWPVMKLGVADLPPRYFRTICIAGGLVVIWLSARVMRVPMSVPAGAWPLVLKLAIPNVIVWHLLAIDQAQRCIVLPERLLAESRSGPTAAS